MLLKVSVVCFKESRLRIAMVANGNELCRT